jgi:hypothetical protein
VNGRLLRAGAHLAEQDRRALVDEDKEGDEADERHEHDQAKGAHTHLDGAADAEVGAIGGTRGGRGVARDRARGHAQQVRQDVQLHAMARAAALEERT